MNIFLGLFGGLGVGTLIGIIVQHFLDTDRLKTERQSNLQKEIYFNLQKHAESIFIELGLLNRQVFEMKYWLTKNIFELNLTKNSIEEVISKLCSAQVYFSKNILDNYDEVIKLFKKIVDVYYDEIGRTGELNQNSIDKFTMLVKDFYIKSEECKSSVLNELEKNKKLIN